MANDAQTSWPGSSDGNESNLPIMLTILATPAGTSVQEAEDKGMAADVPVAVMAVFRHANGCMMQTGYQWWKMYCTHAKRKYIAAHMSSTRYKVTCTAGVSCMCNDSSLVLVYTCSGCKLDTCQADTSILYSICVILYPMTY